MEQAKLISLKGLFNESFSIFKRQPWFFVGLTLAMFFVNIGFSSMGRNMDGFSSVIFSIGSNVVSIIIQIGIIAISLKAVKGEKVGWNDFFSKINVFWQFLGVMILTMLAVLGGMILLIIPGIIFSMMFMFASYVVVDGGETGIVNPMKKSKSITKGFKWKIFLYSIVFALFNFVGLLVFGVGILFTAPVTIIASACLYMKLKEMKGASVAHAEIQVQPQELSSHVA